MKSDTINKITVFISYLPVLGILLIVMSMPFGYNPIQKTGHYLFSCSYVLDYMCNTRWKKWRWDKRYWIYILQIGFFLLVPIWQLFDNQHTHILQRTIEHFLPFLLFGVCGILGMTDKLKIEYVASTMILTSIAIIIYTLTLVGLPNLEHMTPWINNFNFILHGHINSHMILNLYWNFSIILGIYLVWRSQMGKIWKIITAILMIPVFIALCMTDGRTGLLTLVGIILILLVNYMCSHRKWWMTGVILGFLVGVSTFLTQRETFIRATSETNPRIYIWKVTTDMIKERPFLGYGVCSARKEFVERGLTNQDFYNNYTKHLIEYLQTKNKVVDLSIMHPHNVLLETWTQFGIIGVIILLTCLTLPLFMRLGKYQIFLTLCVYAFAMQSIFESLGSSLQPLYFCLMILLWHHQFTLSYDNRELAELHPL